LVSFAGGALLEEGYEEREIAGDTAEEIRAKL
jgi:hypothetical protein